MEQNRQKTVMAVALVLVAIGTRVLFNELRIFNFNAVMATALFAGAFLSQRRGGILVPLIALFATDALIGFYDWRIMMVVYGSFALTSLMGRPLARSNRAIHFGGAILGGSLTFFILTNLATWLFGNLYPYSVEGLLTCFTVALPFYPNTVVSTAVFTGVLFGAYKLYQRSTEANTVTA